MMRSVLAVLALLPLPWVAWAGREMADGLATKGARLADRVARVIAPVPAKTVPDTFVEALEGEPEPPPREATPTRPAVPVPTRGVRVRAETVLRLANAGARPSGIAVPAKGARPAGVALIGVSALGVGLVDGDVLTHADGRPARSVSDVVSAVIGARSQHAREICGRFWRNGEVWNLIVEQPYPKRATQERALVGLAR
jgi:S1-C subfamily serine protease